MGLAEYKSARGTHAFASVAWTGEPIWAAAAELQQILGKKQQQLLMSPRLLLLLLLLLRPKVLLWRARNLQVHRRRQRRPGWPLRSVLAKPVFRLHFQQRRTEEEAEIFEATTEQDMIFSASNSSHK